MLDSPETRQIYQLPVCCSVAQSLCCSTLLIDWPRIHQHWSPDSLPDPYITGREADLLEASYGRKQNKHDKSCWEQFTVSELPFNKLGLDYLDKTVWTIELNTFNLINIMFILHLIISKTPGQMPATYVIKPTYTDISDSTPQHTFWKINKRQVLAKEKPLIITSICNYRKQCGSLVFCNTDQNQAVGYIDKQGYIQQSFVFFLMWLRINKWCCHPLRTYNTASPVFLLQLLVGLLLKLGQKLLQQLLGSISVFERAALVGKVECGALAGVEDQLKLNFGFTIWADLLACAKNNNVQLSNTPTNTPLS